MNDIKIIIPGEIRVKKNSAQHSAFYKDKSGRLVARPVPITYYSNAYKEWAKTAIQTLIVFKSHNQHINFPLEDKMNLKCLFYSQEDKRVDISNLLESIQDVLAGNAGVYKESVPGSLYKIIYDDNVRFIGSVDGTRYLYTPADSPRTEIILSDFKWI